jgi:hypothetical protein
MPSKHKIAQAKFQCLGIARLFLDMKSLNPIKYSPKLKELYTVIQVSSPFARLGVADQLLLAAVLVGIVLLPRMAPLSLHQEPFSIDIVLLLALFLHFANVVANVGDFLELLDTFDLLNGRIDAH